MPLPSRKLPKVKETYSESYTKPGMRFLAHCLPTLPHNDSGFVVVDAYLTKAGVATIDGVRTEFQDVRLYLRPSEEGK